MLTRLGIGARLFIAFLGIAALSLSSGVAGWWILREISGSQSLMTKEALPAVAAAQRTVEASARLVAAGQALAASRDEATRLRHEAELQSVAHEVRKSVADAGLSSVDAEELARLSGSVDALFLNLADQNRLVKERLGLEQRFGVRADRTLAAATEIVDLSETLVSNASAGASAVVANLYGLIDDATRHGDAYEALDRLIEQDIFLLDRMWELRLRSSQLALLTNRLTRAIDRNEVNEIAQGFDRHLRVVKRRIASIDDPARLEQATSYLTALEAAAGSVPVNSSLFGDRFRLIAIGEELGQVAQRNRELSVALGGVGQDILRRAQGFALATSRQAGAAVNAGVYALLITSFFAVTISGLIVWLYVERGVVRRLAELASAMQRLTDGDLAVEVTQGGTHELKSLADAVVAFRDESRQRRALEQERERTNEELRRHREELQDLVRERTVQLENEVKNHAEARDQAERASRAKSDFLATMSHEIRTPMTGMLGMLRILRDGRLADEQRQQVATAAGAGEALLGILNGILDYSKIESGKITVDEEVFSPSELVEGVTKLMQPSAAEKGLALSRVIAAEVAPWVTGDQGKIRQIVFNLVSNAIKFTEAGEVTVRVTAQPAASGRQSIAISVEDTGAGIAPAQLEHIFESFFQADASITRRHGGTGLGLSISRGLAEAIGGKLEVQSEQGRGSCFALSLDLAIAAKPETVAAQGRPAASSRSLRVLVVEDDDATRAVASRFLRDMGHEVNAVADGYAALAACKEHRPDLILLDISLPGMDGIAAARELRAQSGFADVPVIAMSAHVFRAEVDRYLASGMNAYVAKPLSPGTLEEAIARIFPDSAAAHIDRPFLSQDIERLGRTEMMRMLQLVERTLPQRLSSIRLAAENNDLPAVARTAHAAFSSASAIGFAKLGETLTKLEHAANAGDSDACLRLSETCEDLYAAAMAEARAMLVEPAA